jgi:hypothetical protein
MNRIERKEINSKGLPPSRIPKCIIATITDTKVQTMNSNNHEQKSKNQSE